MTKNIEQVINNVRNSVSEDEIERGRQLLEKNAKPVVNNKVVVLSKKKEVLGKVKLATNGISKDIADKLNDGSKETISENRLAEIIDNLTSEDDKKDFDIMKESESIDNKEIKESESTVMDMKVDPETGTFIPQNSDVSSADVDIDDVLKDDIIPLDNQKLMKGIEDVFAKYTDLDGDDGVKLLRAIINFRNDPKYPVYNYLPESIKKMCRSMALRKSLSGFHEAAKDLVNTFLNDLRIDNEIINIQDSINKVLNINNIGDQYCDNLRELMEDKLLNAAEKAKETDPKKSELWKNISNAFTDSYKMNRELDYINNNKSRIKKEIFKESYNFIRLLNKINYKYENNKIGINNIKDAVVVLSRKLDKKYTIIDIKKFIALYYLVTKNYNPENTVEHFFMFYTISNILSLDYVRENKFKTELLSNINIVLDKLEEVCPNGFISSKCENRKSGKHKS